jgi:hypothetical protein
VRSRNVKGVEEENMKLLVKINQMETEINKRNAWKKLQRAHKE